MAANLKIGKGETIDEWLDRLPEPQSDILRALRNLILEDAPHLEERIMWSAPWYTGNDRVFYLACHQNYAVFGVCNGAHLNLPDFELDGTGKNMRHVKVHSFDVVPLEKLFDVLEVAVAYDKSLS